MEFVVMEVTKEEMEKVLQDRIESARKAEIDECVETIKRAVERIEGLGGRVYDFYTTYKCVALDPKEIKGYYHKH